MVKHTLFLAVLLGAWAAPQAGWAGQKEEARKHYDRAIELVDDGQLEGAIVEFQRSYDLTHHFAVLYNVGQVYVSLAKPVEAVDAYQRYLAEGANKIPAARRAELASGDTSTRHLTPGRPGLRLVPHRQTGYLWRRHRTAQISSPPSPAAQSTCHLTPGRPGLRLVPHRQTGHLWRRHQTARSSSPWSATATSTRRPARCRDFCERWLD